MKVLAIIPARGGSKRIHLKNIVRLNKIPLLEHTINSAKNSKYIDKIIVSTDNDKISRVARKTGVEAPLRRPIKISGDSAQVTDLIKHALDSLVKEKYIPDIVVYLQPTSPLRSKELIDKSINKLKYTKASCVMAVAKIKTHPYTSFYLENHKLISLKKDFHKYGIKKKIPKIYHPTGEVYTFWYETIKKFDNMYGNNVKPIISDDKEFCLDIDNWFDLFLCEMTLKNWTGYKKVHNIKN